VGNLRERDHLEDRDLDGRIAVKCSLTSGVGVMDYIHLAQDRGRWQDFVHALMNFRVLLDAGYFLTT